MDKLGARLSALRNTKKNGSGPASADKNIQDPQSVSPGPDWSSPAPYVYKRTITSDVSCAGPFHSILSDRQIYPEKLVFFDLETTGLSGGAGTAVFLAGFGKMKKDKLAVTQIFLSDFPGQAAFLENCISEIDDDSVIVSYNGKSFDIPLLRTKCLMNGIRPPEPAHIDLLHISRRFWKSILDSCSLSSLEKHILGVIRTNDIPGSLVPEQYFRFLKTSDPSCLADVFDHHLQDIRTLGILLDTVNKILSGNASCSCDSYQLARVLLPAEPERAVRILDGLSESDPAASILIALYCKRKGDTAQEAAYWKKALSMEKTYFSVVEYAKCLEHRLKEYRKAADLVKSYLSLNTLSGGGEEALAHRLRRLEYKLEKQ